MLSLNVTQVHSSQIQYNTWNLRAEHYGYLVVLKF